MAPPVAIFHLKERYQADDHPDKINLSVGGEPLHLLLSRTHECYSILEFELIVHWELPYINLLPAGKCGPAILDLS